MTMRSQIMRLFAQEDLNFLLTNRIPRRLATQFVGWISKTEQPLVRDLSIGLWSFFSDLDLSEAKKTQFRSMHDCFIRELKDGRRPIDSDGKILVSPCDAVIGACGTDDRVTRAHENLAVGVDRPPAILELADEAIMHAPELRFFRLAEVQIGKEAPQSNREVANERLLGLADPAYELRGQSPRNTVGQQKIQIFLSEQPHNL